MSTTIRADVLKALTRFVNAKEARYYLKGVLFDPRGYAVATDGAIMMAARIPAFAGSEFILPIETIKLALSMKRVEFDLDSKAIAGISFTPIEGRYPEWRRVIPTNLSGAPGWYDAVYLSKIQTALEDMTSRGRAYVHLAMNGNSGAAMVAGCPDDVVMVIMPMRIADDKKANIPAENERAKAFLRPVSA